MSLPVCPTCGGAVAPRPDGSLFTHQRYADHCGYEADRNHDLITCEATPGVEACRPGNRCANCTEIAGAIALDRKMHAAGFRWIDPQP